MTAPGPNYPYFGEGPRPPRPRFGPDQCATCGLYPGQTCAAQPCARSQGSSVASDETAYAIYINGVLRWSGTA